MRLLRKMSLLGLALCACPASQPASPAYAPKTTLELSTPRCKGQSCRCRALESDEEQGEEGIRPGHKRFEFRLPRTTSALWVEIQGKGQFHKAAEQMAPACFYVDLPVGATSVVMHSERVDTDVGLQTGLVVNEYGPKDGPHWYRTFEFACGGMNRCTKAGMAAWVEFQRKLPRGALNACGSTKVQNVTVTGAREHKGELEYLDMTVRFVLNVYDFETYKAPESDECRVPAESR